MAHLIDSWLLETTLEKVPVEHVTLQDTAQRHVLLLLVRLGISRCLIVGQSGATDLTLGGDTHTILTDRVALLLGEQVENTRASRHQTISLELDQVTVSELFSEGR